MHIRDRTPGLGVDELKRHMDEIWCSFFANAEQPLVVGEHGASDQYNGCCDNFTGH
jgi:hypothetical protein